MRGYWVKILLGAVIVFVVGSGVVRLVRGGIDRKRSVFHSAEPITIPLAFIPFTLDGERIGTFRRLTIRRDAPKVVAGIDVRVALEDGFPGVNLDSCRLTTVEQGQFDIEEGFVCLSADSVDSALVDFGTVAFLGPGRETIVPLLLDSAVVGEMRRSEEGVAVAQRVISVQEGIAAAARAEKAAAEAKRRADSIAASVRPRTP
jgi:hypothetical protein